MFKKIQLLLNKRLDILDEHTREVVQKSSSSTVVKLIGVSIGVGVSIFLGRTIGAYGLGIINLTNRIINILIVICLIGIQQVIVKEVAIAHNKNDYTHIGNVIKTAFRLNGIITFITSIFLILISPWIAENIFKDSNLTYPLIIALIVVTPQVCSRIFSSALIGYRKIWQSNLVDQTLSISITGLLLLIIWLMKWNITINLVAICYAVGRISVTVIVGFYWRTLFQFKAKYHRITKQLIKTSFPLFIAGVSGIIMTNIDVIILGAMTDAKNVGYYTVAASIALLTSFFLQVTNASVAPKIASLYESGKLKDLETMVQKVTRGLGLIGFIQLLVFLIAGKYILGIWGNEFESAYWLLVIIGFGQFINIGTGAVGLILVMCGYEKIQKNISLIFLVIAICFNIIFINFWGALGAAVTLAFVTLGMNVSRYYFVLRKLNIHTVNYKFLPSQKMQ